MLTRNVRWLGKTYGEYVGTKEPKMIDNTEFESSDEEIWVQQSETEVKIVEEKRKTPPRSIVSNPPIEDLNFSLF